MGGLFHSNTGTLRKHKLLYSEKINLEVLVVLSFQYLPCFWHTLFWPPSIIFAIKSWIMSPQPSKFCISLLAKSPWKLHITLFHVKLLMVNCFVKVLSRIFMPWKSKYWNSDLDFYIARLSLIIFHFRFLYPAYYKLMTKIILKEVVQELK